MGMAVKDGARVTHGSMGNNHLCTHMIVMCENSAGGKKIEAAFGKWIDHQNGVTAHCGSC